MEIEGYRFFPTRFGQLTGNISSEYAMYKFNISPTIVDRYFPDKLNAFNTKKCQNLSKRHLFHSKPAITFTRSQIDDNNEFSLSSSSDPIELNSILKDLESENDSKIRYNFVIMDDCLILMRVVHHRHLSSSYKLSKHITLSNRAKQVRYAGQLWFDHENSFLINNHSNVYRPADQLIEQVVEFFNDLIPELEFQGISYQTNSQVSMKRHIIKKIKRKLTLHNH